MAAPIIVGYDGTDCAKAALHVACRLAKDGGHPLVIGYGYEPYQGAGELGGHREALRDRGRTATAEAQADAHERGVEAEVELVQDRSAPALARLAEERGAGYIVVGSYGEKPLTGAILGSTPHKLLYLSTVPVVVVPPEE